MNCNCVSLSLSDGRILIVRHNYVANTDQPGGFKELSIVKGICCQLQYCRQLGNML